MNDDGLHELDALPASAEPPRVPFAVLILVLLGGGLCALLVLNTVTAASEVRQRRLDAAYAGLNDKQQQLSRDVARLQAPDELARRAAGLGLVPADSPAFLRINPDGSVTVLGAPVPASTQPPPPPTTTKTPTSPPTTTRPPTTKPAGTTPTGTQPTTAKPTTTPTGAQPTTPKPATPKPTKTPTPTVTLPGGPR